MADGLVQSGSVDGYVWEALSRTEPALTARTRVLTRSEWLGFPPFCGRSDQMNAPRMQAMQQAILTLDQTEKGRSALALLQLDGMTKATPALYDGIAARMRIMDSWRP